MVSFSHWTKIQSRKEGYHNMADSQKETISETIFLWLRSIKKSETSTISN